MGIISFGDALVAGKNRVPRPAAGNIAFLIVVFIAPHNINNGAGDEGRTRTMRASRDFKSLASASSATPASKAFTVFQTLL